MGIRMAAAADTAALLAIYGQYIDTSITFEYTLPTQAEFTARITGILAEYPYLVWEEDGQILGYAYAHRHMERAAYSGTRVVRVLDRAARRRGLGRRLYGALMELLTMQGVLTAHALVTSPNPASQALHTAMGFHLVAVHRLAGFKAGEWHDVLWYERVLAPRETDPAAPVPLGTLPRPQVEAVLTTFSGPLERH
jgi:phosphinothricin acetyltransferase